MNEYTCKLCQKSFDEKSDFTEHMKTHKGEKRYKCTHCSMAFAKPSKLKSHTRKHTGEKPFKCPHCLKPFARPYSLKIHVRTHTGDKPHRCDICGKDFTTASNRKEHLRVHTQEKPFICSACNKRFSHKKTAKKHASNQHKDTNATVITTLSSRRLDNGTTATFTTHTFPDTTGTGIMEVSQVSSGDSDDDNTTTVFVQAAGPSAEVITVKQGQQEPVTAVDTFQGKTALEILADVALSQEFQ